MVRLVAQKIIRDVAQGVILILTRLVRNLLKLYIKDSIMSHDKYVAR